MPKHKKTREQKKKADMRHSASTTPSASAMPSGTPLYTFSPREFVGKQQTTNVLTHPLVAAQHDVIKTVIVSAVIVTLQLLFYFLLKNHVLAIPFVSY